MKRILIITLIFTSLITCKKLSEMNEDIKNPAELNSPEGLLRYSIKELVRQENNINVNNNPKNLFAQYITQTTYIDESNYDLVNRNIPDNDWERIYTRVLSNLKEAKKVLDKANLLISDEDKVKTNTKAMYDLLECYTYNYLVETYGNVPYSEAINPEISSPKFDDAETIILDLLKRVNDSYNTLNSNSSIGMYSGGDIIYNGDINKWKKFAQSLRVKIAMNIIDVENSFAKSEIEDAIAKGVLSSSADNAKISFYGTSPNTHAFHEDLVLSGRADFVAADTCINKLLRTNDPRLDDFYRKAQDTAIFVGAPYAASNDYSAYSTLSDNVESPTLSGFVLTYSELQFYLAEASEKGVSTGSTTEDHYNNGITSSIIEWGGLTSEVSTYLAQANVAWTTAPGTAKEKIALQSWLASFMRGHLGWTTYRRLDAPALSPRDGETVADVPTRFTYPISEDRNNDANYKAAVTAIGGDYMNVKLFWDVN